MKPFRLLLPLCIILEVGRSFITETEWNIFMALARVTFVKNCLITTRHLHDATARQAFKTLSEDRIYTVFLRPENLRKYLESMDRRVYRWTVIVLKERELASVDYFDNQDIISSYFWMIFDASNGSLREELQKINIPFDSAMVLIEKVTEDHYTISEYYNIKKFAPGVLRKFGDWTNNTFVDSGKDWFDRKSNMQKYEFRSIRFEEELYLTPRDKVNEEIWHELSHLLNFTVVDRVVKYSARNASLDLASEEEEALLGTQIYIESNEGYRYLLGPTSQSGLYMHIKSEGEVIGIIRFLKPFSKYIWLSVVLWLVCGGILMVIFEYLTGKFGLNERPPQESFLMIFASLDSVCNQSGSEIGSNVSSRFVLLLIRFSGLLISYAYSATLISYLLLYIPQLPFTDLKGFVEDGTYKIVAEINSDVDTFFRVSTNPVERLIYEKFLSDTRKWSRLDKEVERLCAGEKLVIVAFDNEIDKYKPCGIVKIKKALKVFANGFKIRFRSPFRGMLHIKLLLMRTTGVLQRVNRRFINTNIRTEGRTEYYKINLEKVLPAFFLLFCGFALSLGILAVEILVGVAKTSKNEEATHRIFF